MIKQVAASRSETNPPHFNTVLDWIDRWLRLGELYGKSALVNRHHLKGNRNPPFDPIGEMAIERGLLRWLKPEMKRGMGSSKNVFTLNIYKSNSAHDTTETRRSAL